jgi:hypothetical protein
MLASEKIICLRKNTKDGTRIRSKALLQAFFSPISAR